MAEKRRPGFNIPLNFYDGAEVESIPRRIRAAAIGVWSLAGNYAATHLTDGYVGPEYLKMFGCTTAIREALKVTINKKGELSPLWIDARNGGVLLTGWAKHQRTNDEVTTYRASEAERKKAEREAKRNGSTSDNGKTSGRTNSGHGPDVRPEAGDPKTETETKTGTTHVHESATDPYAGGISATPGADLVREIMPRGHPPATLTTLRLQASELLNTGTERAVVIGALRLWCSKPSVGLGRTILASLASEFIKSQSAPIANAGGQVHKMRATANLAAELRAAESQALAPVVRKELP